MANRTKRTPKKEQAFLEALEGGTSIAGAAGLAGVGRTTVYEWREADPDFAKRWDDAVEHGTDLLEDEARRRAFEGYDEPVTYQGRITDTVRKYSDTLAIFMLKARRPHKFRDHQTVEHTGKDGGPITTKSTSDLDLAKAVAFILTKGDRQSG